MKSTLRHGKTGLLALLVMASVLLSYYLWSGNLQEAPEIGYVQAPSMPVSATPDMNQAIQPYQIDVHTGSGNTVIQPGTTADSFWTSTFLSAHPYDVTTVKTLPSDMQMSASIQFGVELNRSLAGHWLQNFAQVLGNWQGRNIVIYALPKQTTCRIAFVGDNEVLTVKTDLSYSKLLQTAWKEVSANPYTSWDDFDSESQIPVKAHLPRLTYTVGQVETEPLVHTFFVNPQAITRIQESSDTVLWTDGSRAVQWNEGTAQLKYEDPNGGSANFHNDPLLTGLDFIHSHGGGPENVIGFDQLSTLTNNANSPTFSFTQYVNGYPVLNDETNYDVDIESGHVLEYDRPMWTLQTRLKSLTVDVMDAKHLLAAIHSVDPTDATPELHATLGYAAQTAQLTSGQVTFEPAYYVTTSSGVTWVIDAVDGSVLAGGGIS